MKRPPNYTKHHFVIFCFTYNLREVKIIVKRIA